MKIKYKVKVKVKNKELNKVIAEEKKRIFELFGITNISVEIDDYYHQIVFF